MGCQLLLQGVFLTQGSNPHLLNLLHWQEDSSALSYPGSHRGSQTCVNTTVYSPGAPYSKEDLADQMRDFVVPCTRKVRVLETRKSDMKLIIFYIIICNFVPWGKYWIAITEYGSGGECDYGLYFTDGETQGSSGWITWPSAHE